MGIAVSDAQAKIALPLKVLDFSDVISLGKNFRLILEDYEPDCLVCGLPKNMDGTEGPQAKRVRECAESIAQKAGLQLVYSDERLSSSEAKHSLRELGLSEKQMRGKLDMYAASLILQRYLDQQTQ